MAEPLYLRSLLGVVMCVCMGGRGRTLGCGWQWRKKSGLTDCVNWHSFPCNLYEPGQVRYDKSHVTGYKKKLSSMLAVHCAQTYLRQWCRAFWQRIHSSSAFSLFPESTLCWTALDLKSNAQEKTMRVRNSVWCMHTAHVSYLNICTIEFKSATHLWVFSPKNHRWLEYWFHTKGSTYKSCEFWYLSAQYCEWFWTPRDMMET